MTLKESQLLVSQSLSLTQPPSRITDIPFHKRYLVIVPKNVDFETRMKVFKECSINGWDNESALITTGYINEDLDVYMLLQDGGYMFERHLLSYIDELGKTS